MMKRLLLNQWGLTDRNILVVEVHLRTGRHDLAIVPERCG